MLAGAWVAPFNSYFEFHIGGVPPLVWVAVIGLVALHQHVRTVMAPYLAVHGDLNGTRAALTSWQLGGRHFWHLLGTFILGSLPVALPRST